MFSYKDFSAFKQHVRDFLVQTKAFAAQDNTALFADEQNQLKQVLSTCCPAGLTKGLSQQNTSLSHMLGVPLGQFASAYSQKGWSQFRKIQVHKEAHESNC